MQIDRIGGLSGSIAIKVPCRVATTADILLSGLQSIDGVVLVAGDRVLVKNQTAGSRNGIYIAATGTWTRSADFDGPRDVAKGTLVGVTDGTVAAGQLFKVTTANPITVGTTDLSFAQYLIGVASGVANTPTGGIAATNVQAALNELDTEKALLAGNAAQNFAINNATIAGTLNVSGVTTEGTGIVTVTTEGEARYVMVQSNAAVDNRRWDFVAYGETLRIRALNDVNTQAADIITVNRTAQTIDNVAIGSSLTATGRVTATSGAIMGSFTVATRPAHAAGLVIYVSDGGAGAVFQGSNGSAWVNLG